MQTLYHSPTTGLSLVAACLEDLQDRLANLCIYNGWNDHLWDSGNPALRYIRPSMELPVSDGGRGPGGSLLHQFGAWALSSPNNCCVFKKGTDTSLCDFMQRHGFLHSYCMVADANQMHERISGLGQKLLGNDCYSAQFDDIVVNSRASLLSIGDKSMLSAWVAPQFLPLQVNLHLNCCKQELVREIRHLSADGAYDLYLKSTDGQHGSKGVRRITGQRELSAMVDDVIRIVESQKELVARANREAQEAERLSAYPAGIRKLSEVFVVQQGVQDFLRNGSFQLFLDPRTPETLPVMAVSTQLCTEEMPDGGHLNAAVNAQTVAPIGEAACSLVKRVQAEFPEAFGVLKCDYFVQRGGAVILYDVELRPSGNTPAAAFRIHANSKGFEPFLRSDWQIGVGVQDVPFSEVAKALEDWLDPPCVLANRHGLQPIAWNPVSGKGRFILMPKTDRERVSFEQGYRLSNEFAKEVLYRLRRSFPDASEIRR